MLIKTNAQMTPLCKKCKCQGDILDIDCSEAPISSTIYDYTNFIDESNKTYPINSLNLQNNYLRQVSTEFPESPLKKLDLSFNFIQNIGDMVFRNLQDMNELILSNNNIEMLKADVFMGKMLDGQDFPLKSLRVLKLDYNNIHALTADVFKHVDYEIEVLNLSHNPIKVITVATALAITSLVKLKVRILFLFILYLIFSMQLEIILSGK